ncbi:MAG: MBL fold metallo-hydrolase [Halorientalis sp.]
MRVTFLGTGSAMPTGERFQTGILLEAGDDALLVDCGSGVLHGLARTATGYEGVDTVLLTHHHLDHVADLLPLLKARWLAGAESLTVVGPPGTAGIVAGLLDVFAYLDDRVDLHVRELDPGTSFSTAGFAGQSRETRHSMQCLAYRLTPDGEGDAPTFGFSGDTEADPDLVEFFDGAAVLAHDCSFPDGVEVSNHPTPRALGEALADADADVGRVYLTHLYPHAEGEQEAMLASLAEHYEGDVRFAADGLSLTVD